ncbi:kinase-like protein [Schizophyllum commune Loenen D]|nr:kinase-like protein [Schizophyllum commune Loenen D]
MPKQPRVSSPATHPPVGTLIDDDSLELVEVLGVGGYGVVYRAVDTYSSRPQSYAVKCLFQKQSARHRQAHLREVALHQAASAHPNVITLHRVIEDEDYTFIIMDYAPDQDLFTQILHNCRYLGNNELIKHVFLQLLDAVEFCHSLGIYHRDLKPENVLCFDEGLRVAITDFGLSTTDKYSDEFRTGSVYHMSPECQGGDYAPARSYSPLFNDIWSLGIILLNLMTGRNPWKSASISDPTFQAYLHDPMNFLPSVLPISAEINDVLIRMLDVNWRRRISLAELRIAIEDITDFYADTVVFEGSMAKCAWECGADIHTASSSSSTKQGSPAASPTKSQQNMLLESRWSKDSSSELIFATRSVEVSPPASRYAEEGALSSSSSDSSQDIEIYDRSRTPYASQSSGDSIDDTLSGSLPRTPYGAEKLGRRDRRKTLTIDTNWLRPQCYDPDARMASASTLSSIMHTAIELDSLSPSLLVHGQRTRSMMSVEDSLRPSSAMITDPYDAEGETEEDDMTSPSAWGYSVSNMSFAEHPSDVSSPVSVVTNVLFPETEAEPHYYQDLEAQRHPLAVACPSPCPDTIVWPEHRSPISHAQSQSASQSRPPPLASRRPPSLPPPPEASLSRGRPASPLWRMATWPVLLLLRVLPRRVASSYFRAVKSLRRLRPWQRRLRSAQALV